MLFGINCICWKIFSTKAHIIWSLKETSSGPGQSYSEKTVIISSHWYKLGLFCLFCVTLETMHATTCTKYWAVTQLLLHYWDSTSGLVLCITTFLSDELKSPFIDTTPHLANESTNSSRSVRVCVRACVCVGPRLILHSVAANCNIIWVASYGYLFKDLSGLRSHAFSKHFDRFIPLADLKMDVEKQQKSGYCFPYDWSQNLDIILRFKQQPQLCTKSFCKYYFSV